MKRKIRHLLSSLFVLINLTMHAIAQNNTSTRFFAPIMSPSPAAASLGKYGDLPIDLSTGAATASIPLYNLNIRNNYEIKFGLNYSSNGVRVDDIAGNTGTDWSFLGLFAIRRTVFDDPDELSTDLTKILDNGFKPDSLSKLTQYAKASYIDAQPDIFTLIAPGFSGRFYLLKDTAVFLNQNTSYKIVRIPGYGFKVNDGKGNVMLFGGDAIETTRMQSACPNEDHYPSGSHVPTAWFVKNITTPNKDIVNFFYSDLSYSYTTNRIIIDVLKQTPKNEAGCYCDLRQKTQCTMEMIVGGKKLDYLVTSNQAKITFDYEYRKDNIGDRLLKSMSVYSTFGAKNVLLQNMKMEYSYGNNRKRPFLSRVAILSGDAKDSMIYNMNYNNLDGLPDRLADGADAWGYYEAGKVNGTLSKITYPTGGYDEIFYESNTLNTLIRNVNWIDLATFNGYGEDDHRCKDYIKTAIVRKPSSGFLRVSAEANWEFPQPPDLQHMSLEVKDAQTGIQYYSKRIDAGKYLSYESFENAAMFSGKDSAILTLKMSPCGQYVYGRASFQVGIPEESYQDVAYGGVRTAKVQTVDKVGKVQVKEYYYGYGEDGKGSSSGVVSGYSSFVEDYYTSTLCSAGTTNECYYQLQHNQSLVNLFSYSAAPLYYNNVTVSYGEDYKNGGVQYEFDIRLPIQPNVISEAMVVPRGSAFVEAPFSSPRDPIAVEKKKTYFKKAGETIKIVKTEEYEYSSPISLLKQRKGYAMRQRYFVGFFTDPSQTYTQYDIAMYILNSTWYGKKKTIETIYSDDNLNTNKSVLFYYDNIPANNNVTRIEMMNSRLDVEKENFKYASDLITLPVYDSMVRRNMIDVVIESKKEIGTRTVSIEQSSYEFMQPDKSIIELSNVKLQKFNFPLEQRYGFYQYDVKGNILERSKTGDVMEVYIWGYGKQYPVAKIVGSDYTKVKSLFNQTVVDTSTNDQQIRDELNKIRIGLTSVDAQVTTYTYLPLVGITSETSPEGRTIFYEYDNFQRLRLIKDQNGKILKQFDYQYQAPLQQ